MSEPSDAARAQLTRILNSRPFQLSELQRRFLSFVVEKTLNGQGDEIKEYVIGAEAFGRGQDFDPRLDSVVRVVARRVRERLAEYYRTEGRDDTLLIRLPKGGYLPSFETRPAQPPRQRSSESPSPSPAGEAEFVNARISHYELLEVLGRGAAGVVYRAEDLRLKRGVAIKFLSESLAANPDTRERFQREARSASAVNHASICAIYDIGEHLGRPFIVMELVEGKTLGRFIDGKPLPPDVLIDLGIQLADALAMAHARGIVHRDLRPGNIVINSRGHAKLLDFGLAELLPQPDAHSDVAGLGTILYEMATGQSPSASDNPSPGLVNPSLPAELDCLIRAAMRADPDLGGVAGIHRELVRLKLARDRAAPESANQRRIPGSKPVWSGLAAAMLLCLIAYFLARPGPPPKILKYTKLTHDGQGKLDAFSEGTPAPVVTDGSRVYFSEVSGSQVVISEVSASGGETVPLRPDLKTPLVAMDISPAHSGLLATDFFRKSPDQPLLLLPLPGGAARPVGDLIGHDGAWSPDGRRICYASGNRLYIAGVDGTGSRLLASLPGMPSWPRWSPGGSTLRFTLQDANGGTSLWQISSDGRKLQPLLPGWNEHPAECCGSWSPNGKYFVFQATRQGSTGLWVMPKRHWPFGGFGTAPVRLTSGAANVWAPAFSRDGRRVFAVVQQRRGELVRYDSSLHTFNIFLSGISADHVEFSRDLRWIAYCAYPEQTIWRSRPDGTERLQLSPPSMAAIFPRWSPDGKRIAFLGTLPGKTVKIYVVASSGGDAKAVLPGDSTQIDPNWSPDGGSLMFATLPSVTDMAGGRPVIQILNLKTQGLTTLPGSEGLTAPRWSFDGRFVVATALSQGKWGDPAVRIFDFRTGAWTGLEKDPIDNKWWSPDGKYFYFDKYTNGDPAIFRIRIADRRIERIAGLKNVRRAFNEMGWWMGIAPDGSPMVLRDTSIEEIYALDLDLP